METLLQFMFSHKMKSHQTMSSLIIYRDTGDQVVGSLGIYLDEKKAALIKDGETVEIPIQPGDHDLQINNGYSHTKTISFNISKGESLKFYCYNEPTNFVERLFYFYGHYKKLNAIYLSKLESEESFPERIDRKISRRDKLFVVFILCIFLIFWILGLIDLLNFEF